MEYKTREYPLFSACGLNCGLCPRHYTDGTSRCPGCAGEGFSEVHPACGILSCCQRKSIEFCFECDDFPCKKYNGADLTDSFITHKNQISDLERAKRIGMDACKAGLNEKVKALEVLLKTYDDGRRKSFFCNAVNLLDLEYVKTVVERSAKEVPPDSALKEKVKSCVRIFEEIAEQKGVSIKLRK